MGWPAKPAHESTRDLRRASSRQRPPQGLPTAPLPAAKQGFMTGRRRKATSYKEVHPLMAPPRAARQDPEHCERLKQGQAERNLNGRRLELALAARLIRGPLRLAPPAQAMATCVRFVAIGRGRLARVTRYAEMV